MDRLPYLAGILVLFIYSLILTAHSQSDRCIDAGPVEVNETHPCAPNGTDTEQLANLTSFCPFGSLDVYCVDEKNESMRILRNTSAYIATCDQVNGLMCRPYGNEHCPDFSAVYTCTCKTSTASTQKTTPLALKTNPATPDKGTVKSSNRTSTPSTETHLPKQGLPSGNSGVVNGLNFNLFAALIVLRCFI